MNGAVMVTTIVATTQTSLPRSAWRSPALKTVDSDATTSNAFQDGGSATKWTTAGMALMRITMTFVGILTAMHAPWLGCSVRKSPLVTSGEANLGLCMFGEFKCANKKCISAFAVCDDIDDCGDASDERGCREWFPILLCLPDDSRHVTYQFFL